METHASRTSLGHLSFFESKGKDHYFSGMKMPVIVWFSGGSCELRGIGKCNVHSSSGKSLRSNVSIAGKVILKCFRVQTVIVLFRLTDGINCFNM